METRNIALRLSYTGTAYHGWQVQKNAVSVAETLEKALASVVCHPVRATGAGPSLGLFGCGKVRSSMVKSSHSTSSSYHRFVI